METAAFLGPTESGSTTLKKSRALRLILWACENGAAPKMIGALLAGI